MTSPFMLSTSEPRDGSSEDEMVADSDFEHFGSVNDIDTNDTTVRWFGRIELMHRLAIQIVAGAALTASENDLELALMKRMAAIPYSDRVTRAQSACTEVDTVDDNVLGQSAFGKFVTLLGSAALKSGSAHRSLVNNLMMEEDTRGSTVDETFHLGVRQSTNNTRPDESWNHGSEATGTSTSTDADLPRYTMLLKEYGDSSGDEPLYQDRQLALHPPLFEAIVHVGLLKFHGKAKTKKQAKHRASQQACKHLGISI